MTILFMGSGPFGIPTLRRLAGLSDRPPLVVATVPDAPRGRRGKLEPTVVKAAAQELDLPCSEVATLKKPHGEDLIRSTGARLVLVADFRLMLTSRFLRAAPCHCYNLHGSVLPRWRGAAPIARAIWAGEREFGVTLYRMVRALDAGPIVATVTYHAEDKQDTETVETEVSHLAADLAEEWWPSLLRGEVPAREQDQEQVTLAPKLEKHEGWVDWSRPAAEIENQILALRPWPRTFTEWRDPRGATQRIFVDGARPGAGGRTALAGEVRGISAEGIEVACGPTGEDRILLLQLQRAGKRSLPVTEFLRGTHVAPGDRLFDPNNEQD